MEKLKIIFLGLISLLLFNCGSHNATKFYKAIMKNDNDIPKEKVIDSNIYYGKKEFGDPDRDVLSLLKKQLKNTNHIYYTYIPEVRGYIPHYSINVYVYDVDNDISYFIKQKDNKLKEFELGKMFDEYDVFRNNFIVEQIKNNNCDSILSIKREFSDEVGQVVYDINLKEKTVNRCSFNRLSLMKEFTEYYKNN